MRPGLTFGGAVDGPVVSSSGHPEHPGPQQLLVGAVGRRVSPGPPGPEEERTHEHAARPHASGPASLPGRTHTPGRVEGHAARIGVLREKPESETAPVSLQNSSCLPSLGLCALFMLNETFDKEQD